MKKKYVAPEADVVSFVFQDVLAASTYSTDPQDPSRDGEDSAVDDPFGGG